MAERSMFVGMDVHKESINVSLAEEGRDGEIRRYGVINGDVDAVAKLVRALRAPNRRLRFVYEAGPCGFGIHRYLAWEPSRRTLVGVISLFNTLAYGVQLALSETDEWTTTGVAHAFDPIARIISPLPTAG